MGVKLDLSGKEINGLYCCGYSHTTDNGKTAWVFKCSCGSLFTAIGSNIISKRTNSCGICVKTIDLTGKRFGKWTVISKAGYRHKADSKRICEWLCECSCGSVSRISTASLNNGTTKSCGKCISELEAGLKYIFVRYKSEAKSKNREFSISFEQFKHLIQSNYAYCAAPPSNKKKLKRKLLGHVVYNGIDRVDSNRGYNLINCVSCCYSCNIAKSDMTQSEFFEWVLTVAKQIANNKASDNSSSGWGE